MHKHEFIYTPILIGGSRRYYIDLPVDAAPIRFWTMTTDMWLWNGQVTKTSQGRAWALIRHSNRIVEVYGVQVGVLVPDSHCCVMEHLNINGEMELMIGPANILDGNKNFVNFGIPGDKYLRIDIYTGDSRIINGN